MPHLTTAIRANDSRTITVEKDIIYSSHPGNDKCTLNTKNKDYLIDKTTKIIL